MVDYKLFAYAGPPRTGSTWMMKACAAVGLGEGFKKDVHQPFPEEPGARLRVATVRNPADWLRSYYQALKGGHTGVDAVDELSKLKRSSWDDFIWDYLKKKPGSVIKIFDSYNADSYLRLEDMPWAFAELLESVGVPSGRRMLCYHLDKQNRVKSPIRITPQQRKSIYLAEQETLDRYHYYLPAS